MDWVGSWALLLQQLSVCLNGDCHQQVQDLGEGDLYMWD